MYAFVETQYAKCLNFDLGIMSYIVTARAIEILRNKLVKFVRILNTDNIYV